ncbi:hypothetical protein IGI04_040345, partial [Brassica rapa subsp. trilocularis]
MNRSRKRKEPSLMDELKQLELLDEGVMVDMPDLELDDLIEENTLSVKVRCLNPYVHKVGGLVKALPPIWGMEDRVTGRGVGDNRVQFIFEAESDLQYVLSKGPWFVNGWMVSLDRWAPNPGPQFLKRIPFWIRIRGLQIHLLKEEVVESLMGPLGHVEKIELHAKNSNSLEYIRALVWINTEEPIQFRRTARFKSGVTLPTELEYEKLFKVCYTCKRLSHDQTRCPLQAQLAQGSEGVTKGRKGGKDALSKEGPSRGARKGVEIKEADARRGSRGDKAAKKAVGKGDTRKGKAVAEAPQLIWKQKSSRGSGTQSRSTQESTAISKGSEDQSGPASVFNRLSGLQEVERVEVTLEDLREKISGGSSGGKNERKSGKGSRSPPPVFERLGSLHENTPAEKCSEGGSFLSKRRRLSGSDERISKKLKMSSNEKSGGSHSVFKRLGDSGKGSGRKEEETISHSAQVAACTPIHSAR